MFKKCKSNFNLILNTDFVDVFNFPLYTNLSINIKIYQPLTQPKKTSQSQQMYYQFIINIFGTFD